MKNLKLDEKWKISLFLVVLLVILSAVFGGRRTVLKPLDASSSANKYIAEFHKYRFGEVSESVAPNGAARIETSTNALFPFTFFETCRTLSLKAQDGRVHRILAANDAESGSGTSVFWGWSSDSKAVFISGAHAGLDCRGSDRRPLKAIYTLDDKSVWIIP